MVLGCCALPQTSGRSRQWKRLDCEEEAGGGGQGRGDFNVHCFRSMEANTARWMR